MGVRAAGDDMASTMIAGIVVGVGNEFPVQAETPIFLCYRTHKIPSWIDNIIENHHPFTQEHPSSSPAAFYSAHSFQTVSQTSKIYFFSHFRTFRQLFLIFSTSKHSLNFLLLHSEFPTIIPFRYRSSTSLRSRSHLHSFNKCDNRSIANYSRTTTGNYD